MDIIKELELGNIENNFQDSIDYIEEQQKILDKKSHIFKVVRLANAIEDLENNGIFNSHNIEFINLMHKYNSPSGNFVRFVFDNSTEEIPFIINGKYSEPYLKIRNYFDALDGFSDENIQEDDFEVSINLKGNITEQIFNVLLSQELRTVVGYSKMQLELKGVNDTPKQNKPKM